METPHNKLIEEKVQEFVDKFVAPTIPGSLGSIQVDHIRLWLRPALADLLATREAQMIEALEDHYWDTFEPDQHIILKHIKDCLRPQQQEEV